MFYSKFLADFLNVTFIRILKYLQNYDFSQFGKAQNIFKDIVPVTFEYIFLVFTYNLLSKQSYCQTAILMIAA